jgi:hypothetical protein
VENADQVFDRLEAMFIGFEFLKLITPAQFLDPAIRYVNMLRDFYREHGSRLPFATMADSLIRKQVDKITTEAPATSYPAALALVLDTKHYLWDRAITMVEMDLLRDARGTKRALEPKRSDDSASTATPGRRPNKRQRQKANRSSRPRDPPAKSRGKGATAGRSRSPPRSKGNQASKSPKKIPKSEMDKIMSLGRENKGKKICRFYNSSAGCSKGETCSFDHKCLQCGLGHSWADHHK